MVVTKDGLEASNACQSFLKMDSNFFLQKAAHEAVFRCAPKCALIKSPPRCKPAIPSSAERPVSRAPSPNTEMAKRVLLRVSPSVCARARRQGQACFGGAPFEAHFCA